MITSVTFETLPLCEYLLAYSTLKTLVLLGRKKNTCGSGSRLTLFFSADPIIFSTRLTVWPYFLRVIAGCCQNGICCHTNYWKNHEKNIQKNYFWPTDPNFFVIWNWNHRYFFTPCEPAFYVSLSSWIVKIYSCKHHIHKDCLNYVFFYVWLNYLYLKISCCKHHIHKVYIQYVFFHVSLNHTFEKISCCKHHIPKVSLQCVFFYVSLKKTI
jgi:hypothetical protein